MTIVRTALLALLSMGFAAHANAAAVGAPMVLYTDIASGPNSGGENNRGAYLSIFGKNFGPTGLGSLVRVTIGGAEVADYRFLGTAKGRADIQRISVQIGALQNPAPGIALPVQVLVDGVGSNTDQTFTVNPGRMLFVDNVHGNDITAVAGDINHPYRHVQISDTTKAAYGAMQPGDIVVLRGTGQAWTDLGNDTYFTKFIGKSASAPTGTSGTGPFTLMAYPGEDVFVDVVGNATQKGAISGIDTTGGYLGGLWITIADLRIESGGNAGVIAVQIDADHWRIVNNELTAATATNNALAAGINGNGTNSYWVGNHIHDIAGGAAQENHGIYIDGDGSYEIAYNTIDHVSGGNGMQIYVNGDNGSDSCCSNMSFHHNIVHDISKHGINIADGSQNNIRVWNNIVYNTVYANLRFNTNTLHGAKIYNNTFYNAVTSGSSNYGAITNDWNFPSDGLNLENNIVVPTAARKYTGGSVGIAAGIGTLSNNLWNGGSGGVAFDTHAVTGQPAFVDAASADFHLQTGSAAIDAGASAVSALVGNDYDVTETRPAASPYDIGAYEFDLALKTPPPFPARILDTRSGGQTTDGLFAGAGPLTPKESLDLNVAGRATVPLSGGIAALLNVTVTNPATPGYLTVWPTGNATPQTSNLNFVQGQTVPNLVLAQFGSNGQTSLRNGSAGNIDLIADVAWYFTAASQLNALAPARLLDTRPGYSTVDGFFEAGGALNAHTQLDLTIAGRDGMPANGIGAVVMNVTATQPSAPGFVTVWPSDQTRPLASNLNYLAAQTIPNMVISTVSANGNISFYNGSAGTTHLIADVMGWFPQGSALTPLTPARLLDTRNGATTTDSRFAAIGSLNAKSTLDLAVTGRGGVPASGAGAVILNVTAVAPGAAGHLTAWPWGTARPVASNLNFVAGQIVPNLVVAAIGSNGKVSLFNGSSAPTDMVVDVFGWLPAGP